jgi:hypothetical protein
MRRFSICFLLLFCSCGAGLTISFPKKFDYPKSIIDEIKNADCDGLKELQSGFKKSRKKISLFEIRKRDSLMYLRIGVYNAMIINNCNEKGFPFYF